MALMQFREGNQIAWVGCRPAHRGTQVDKSVSNVTNTTTDLYQVGAGKVGFITSMWLGVEMNVGTIQLLHTTSANVVITVICELHINNAIVSNQQERCFWPPFELISQEKLRVLSDRAGLFANAHCHGWEE